MPTEREVSKLEGGRRAVCTGKQHWTWAGDCLGADSVGEDGHHDSDLTGWTGCHGRDGAGRILRKHHRSALGRAGAVGPAGLCCLTSSLKEAQLPRTHWLPNTASEAPLWPTLASVFTFPVLWPCSPAHWSPNKATSFPWPHLCSSYSLYLERSSFPSRVQVTPVLQAVNKWDPCQDAPSVAPARSTASLPTQPSARLL